MKGSEIVVVVHKAIDREKDAISLYLKLAKAVKDPKAKNVLINLATDEVGHLDKLERHLTSILSGKEGLLPSASEVRDAMAAQLTESSKFVFPSAAELAKADEIRILEIAVEREIVANRTYLEMAASAQSAVAKEMFLSLAKEEETHAKILRAEVDSIGQNGFWFDMQEFTMEQ
ncbi:MAG: rubrerythrin domain protein [Deltaproteobacteria bacterium]|jgi:rubrerythrin|nr:rubrerythrin domain protein [Deltaproteobacteria bacterium]